MWKCSLASMLQVESLENSPLLFSLSCNPANTLSGCLMSSGEQASKYIHLRRWLNGGFIQLFPSNWLILFQTLA